jgi:hypothetical protein
MRLIDLFSFFQLLCIMLYFLLAAQGGFYLLAHAKVLYNLPTGSFLELRKATDNIIALPLKILYPATLVWLLVWIWLADRSNIFNYVFIIVAAALLAADLALAIRFSIPLNSIIEKLPVNTGSQALVIQVKWIKVILIRGCLCVHGFAFLILHLLAKTS